MPYEWVIKPPKTPASTGVFSSGDGGNCPAQSTPTRPTATTATTPTPTAHPTTAPPLAKLHLWPYRSLPKRGFVWVIGLAFGLLMIPLLALVGSVLLWGMLPFTMGALALLWFFIGKSYRDGEVLEELCLWPDTMRLTRSGPKGRVQSWQANPYWVRLNIHKTAGPVAHYLTLKGGGTDNPREVEIGAFLSEAERKALQGELAQLLHNAR